MTFILLNFLIACCITLSIKSLFSPYKIKGKRASLENLLLLSLVYITVSLGFAMIYLLFDMNGYAIVKDNFVSEEDGFLPRLQSSFYFSAMTLFSVGYGDLSPIGVGRMIAVIEALIGYTIPAAFVARTIIDR